MKWVCEEEERQRSERDVTRALRRERVGCDEIAEVVVVDLATERLDAMRRAREALVRADDIIKQGRVSVNGKILEEPGFVVNEGDDVRVDGRKVRPPKKTKVILFHKPAGCVCSAHDPQGRSTVYDYLPTIGVATRLLLLILPD